MNRFAAGKLLWYLLLIVMCQHPIFAQTITNADGSALTTLYCWKNENYAIKGQPAGGVFSGSGIFQYNGQTYFNPDSATKNTTVFPAAFTITYTVNGTAVQKSVIVGKPVVFRSPQPDGATCDGNFRLEANMQYAGAYQYQWQPTSPLEHADANVTNDFIAQTQTFVITAEDLTNGCTGSDSITITRSAIPVVKVAQDTITIKAREQIMLNASGALNYRWFPDIWLDNDRVSNPVAAPQMPTIYSVTGTNSDGCSGTSQVVINIVETLFVPTAFSPNGDGLNDVFSVENIGYQAVAEFRVFNRWGHIVYEGRDGTKGWDGNCKGQAADAGSYHYLIRLHGNDGKQQVFKGEVTLLR